MRIAIPDFALVCLIGPSGSGKSTFAARHFLPTETVSSDRCRATVSDDEGALDANDDTFELLGNIVDIRLRRRLLTVVDATSVRPPDRASLVAHARRRHALPVAIVLDMAPALCESRNAADPVRARPAGAAARQSRALRKGIGKLQREGFRQVHVIRDPADIETVEIVREPLWTDRRAVSGPFDVVGDVHGCFDELVTLLGTLGYVVEPFEADAETPILARHPEGRQILFVGDLTDRGPRNVDCLRLVRGMCGIGSAEAVVGNHDQKLQRWLRGNKVNIAHGLEVTVAELERTSEAFRRDTREFLYGLRSHLWLDGGRLVVAHAGLKASMHGRGSAEVRAFAMYGETNGEIDEFGLPVRLDWARDYRGDAAVVFGHTPVPDAEWLNGTLCIDTGCVFGGKLTALRWPEREIVSVPALAEYAVPARPIASVRGPSAQQDHDALLYFDDFARKLRVECRLGRAVTVPEQNSLAALEVMSRFAIDPRWLVHLPPTMAACPTAADGAELEHPLQALDHYLARGVVELVAEEKHMGSRAILVVARDADAARSRFGVEDGKRGVVYTRTGRAFFPDDALEAALVERVGDAMAGAGLWAELDTDWVVLDAELMPWSAKAGALVDARFRPTARAAAASAAALLEASASLTDRPELAALRERAEVQRENARAMRTVMDGYCWPVAGIDDYRLAPFHLLAAEGHVFADRPHVWHMRTLERLAANDPVLAPTGWRTLRADDENDRTALVDWWRRHTDGGGEGLVVKPAAFTVHDAKGFVQPAMKVRGRDYLRLVYGPDYDLPEHLSRLRQRNLGRKFSLAEREYRLGIEGLHRFVERRPLAQVHECAIAVLGLESEPVDPRL